jgi:biopolymer transport protein ExbD
MTATSTFTFKAHAWLRTRRHHFHLDMTPMVGLAFLLLTFFLLHAGAAKPRVVQLTMPSNNPHKACGEYRIRGMITIMLGHNHSLYYYHGLNNLLDTQVSVPELKSTDFSVRGIRQVLLAQDKLVQNFILIKPTPGATYKDMVDILDEMKITGQRLYALVPLTAADRQLLLANERQ